MENKHRWETVLLVLADLLILSAIVCVVWSAVDRLGWVRFVATLPLPGWLKMILWGWY